MPYDVVAISHASGADGTEVGRLVAERLGFLYVDEEIVALAAARGGVDPAEIADEERRRPLLARVLDVLAETGGGAEAVGLAPPVAHVGSSDSLRAFIRAAIEEAATRSSTVIVAHAASHALAASPNVLRVLVTASPDTRMHRLAREHGSDEADARRALQQSDAGRADYLKRFYGVRAELPTQYDLVVNTDRLSPEQAALVIIEAAT